MPFFLEFDSARILGERRWGDVSQTWRNLMPFLYRLHYSLALGAVGTWLLGLVSLLWMHLDAVLAVLPDNRTLELLDLSHSSSAGLRHQLTEQALASIGRHPLLGEYGNYEPGLYAHNLLSAWVDLGLLGFAALLALLIYPLTHLAIHGYLLGGRTSRDHRYLLAWSLLTSTLLLLCLSHFFSDMLIGAALGAYARYRSGH